MSLVICTMPGCDTTAGCKCGQRQHGNDALRTEIERLTAALRDVIADIHEYERVNRLSPNPPRMECWDSVARALRALGAKSVQSAVRHG